MASDAPRPTAQGASCSAFGLLAAVALALPALAALSLVQRQAPALNTALRVESWHGSARQGPAMAMYDRGAYLFQAGHDALYADAIAPRSPTAAAATRAKATALFESALRRDPANAHIWQAYAQSLLHVPGAEARAARALDRSAALAPTSPLLAAARLQTLRTLRDWTGDPTVGAARAAADLAVLQRHAPRAAVRFAPGGTDRP